MRGTRRANNAAPEVTRPPPPHTTIAPRAPGRGGPPVPARGPHGPRLAARVSTSPTRKPRMRLVGRLAVDPHRPIRDQSRTVAARPHEPCAPQPLVEPLPSRSSLSFRLIYRRSAASAANGPGHCGTSSAARAPGGAAARSWPGPAAQRVPSQAGGGQHADPDPPQHRRQQLAAAPKSARQDRPAAPPGRGAPPRPVRRATRSATSSRSSTGPASSQPTPRRSPPASPAAAAARPGPAAAGLASRHRAAAPRAARASPPRRGFSSAGRNSAKRPAAHAERLQRRRADAGDRRLGRARHQPPGPRPAGAAGRAAPASASARAAAANSGARSRANPVVHEALQPPPHPLALRAVEELAVAAPPPSAAARVAPGRSRATGAPSQISAGPRSSAKAASGRASSAATRRGISSRSARRAARSTSFFSSPSAGGSGMKAKPPTWPTG